MTPHFDTETVLHQKPTALIDQARPVRHQPRLKVKLLFGFDLDER
jgi:hypothetical protein